MMHDRSSKSTAPRDGALDRTGAVVSLACAIHCALMPIALGLLAVLGTQWMASSVLEWSIVGLSAALGLFSLVPSYRNKHREPRCLIFFLSGLGLILIARLLLFSNIKFEIPTVVCGGVLIAVAHIVNRRLCQSCVGCNAEREYDVSGRDDETFTG
jgi:MerC mercury resistance protein